jgi:hypothetical protein
MNILKAKVIVYLLLDLRAILGLYVISPKTGGGTKQTFGYISDIEDKSSINITSTVIWLLVTLAIRNKL